PPARSLFIDSESFRKDFFKGLFFGSIGFFIQRIYFSKKGFFFIKIRTVFYLFPGGFYLRGDVSGSSLNLFSELCGLTTQAIVAHLLNITSRCFYFSYYLFYFLTIGNILVSQKAFKSFVYKTHIH